MTWAAGWGRVGQGATWAHGVCVSASVRRSPNYRQCPEAVLKTQGSACPASMAQSRGRRGWGWWDDSGSMVMRERKREVKSSEAGARQDLHSPGLSFLIWKMEIIMLRATVSIQ